MDIIRDYETDNGRTYLLASNGGDKWGDVPAAVQAVSQVLDTDPLEIHVDWFHEGVIADETGRVVWNMTQHGTVVRVQCILVP